MHGLQPVAYVRQRATDDDAHRVVEIRALHFLDDGNRLYACRAAVRPAGCLLVSQCGSRSDLESPLPYIGKPSVTPIRSVHIRFGRAVFQISFLFLFQYDRAGCQKAAAGWGKNGGASFRKPLKARPQGAWSAPDGRNRSSRLATPRQAARRAPHASGPSPPRPRKRMSTRQPNASRMQSRRTLQGSSAGPDTIAKPACFMASPAARAAASIRP